MSSLCTFIRKWLSFVAFDEPSVANGDVAALSTLVKAFAESPLKKVPHDDSALSKAFQDCSARFREDRTPAQDGAEGGFAWWRKSRARYACCILLNACCGWLKSSTSKNHILLYAEVLDCLVGNIMPRINKGEVEVEENDITLDQYATLAGGYSDDETEIMLSIYDNVIDMTDARFMQITAKEMLTVQI